MEEVIKCPECGGTHIVVEDSLSIEDGVNINPDRNEAAIAFRCLDCLAKFKNEPQSTILTNLQEKIRSIADAFPKALEQCQIARRSLREQAAKIAAEQRRTVLYTLQVLQEHIEKISQLGSSEFEIVKYREKSTFLLPAVSAEVVSSARQRWLGLALYQDVWAQEQVLKVLCERGFSVLNTADAWSICWNLKDSNTKEQ